MATTVDYYNMVNELIKLDGVIIGDVDYKEYDKLITIITKQMGKIKVYAFNIRRPHSKSIGKIRLFSFGKFELKDNNGKYQLENMTLVDSFDKLVNDYESTCYASYFVELADYFCVENIESSEMYTLIYYTFKAILDGKVPLKLIRRVYELKSLKYQGEYKESDSLSTDDSSLKYTWNFVLNTKPDKLYTFVLNDKTFELFDREVALEMREKVTKKFKTIDEFLKKYDI